jgi:hypothetical protein
MRRLAIALVPLLMLSLGPAAFAQDDGDEPTEWERQIGNKSGIGLNGILTAPADPVMFAIEGSEVFGGGVGGNLLGFGAGLFQMPYRIITGAFDFVTCWVPYLYMISPPPRFKLLPFATHDDE